MYKAPKTPFVCLRTLQVVVAKKVKQLDAQFGVNNLLFGPNWYATLICANLQLSERALVIDGVIRYKRDIKYYSQKIDFVAAMFERQFAKYKKVSAVAA